MNILVEITLLGFLKDSIPVHNKDELVGLLHEYEKETNVYSIERAFVENTFNASIPSEFKEYWVLVFHNTEMIGFGYCYWQIKFENLANGTIRLFVKEQHRRKKIGSKMLIFLLKNIDDQVNILTIKTVEGASGEAFLRKLKGNLVYTGKVILSRLSDFTNDEIEQNTTKTSREAKEKGFKIKVVNSVEYEALAHDPLFVTMVERNWNATPTEGQSSEPIILTSERLLESISYRLKRGDNFYTVITIHNESLKYAGYTITRVNEHLPKVGFQHDTGVLEEYRGNNLGLTMKYKLLQHLKNNTGVEFWETGSAASNIYMRRINDELKHKPLKTKLVFEFRKLNLQEKLENH